MPYFAIFDTATGELVSTGTDVADGQTLLDAGLESVRLNGSGPPAGKLWNPATRKFDVNVPVPPTDDEVLEADETFAELTESEQRMVRVLARLIRGGA